MSLVDDENSVAALAGEVGEGSAELREETSKAKGGFSLESEKDLTIESSDGEMGVGEVDDGVEIAVEGVGEGAEGRMYSSAWTLPVPTSPVMRAGRRSWRAKARRPLDLLMATRREEIRARDRFAERGGAKAIKVIESGHRYRSPLDWMVRVGKSEWYRVAAE